MDATNVNIKSEEIMYHGTAADGLVNINQNGFNRSYCGKNGKYIFYNVQARFLFLNMLLNKSKSTALF